MTREYLFEVGVGTSICQMKVLKSIERNQSVLNTVAVGPLRVHYHRIRKLFAQRGDNAPVAKNRRENYLFGFQFTNG